MKKTAHYREFVRGLSSKTDSNKVAGGSAHCLPESRVRGYDSPPQNDTRPSELGFVAGFLQSGKIRFGDAHGYAVDVEGEIWIPMIRAEDEGSGAVGKFLDSLSARCRVVNVCSRRLADMLLRRGWKREIRQTEEGNIDVWRA